MYASLNLSDSFSMFLRLKTSSLSSLHTKRAISGLVLPFIAFPILFAQHENVFGQLQLPGRGLSR